MIEEKIFELFEDIPVFRTYIDLYVYESATPSKEPVYILNRPLLLTPPRNDMYLESVDIIINALGAAEGDGGDASYNANFNANAPVYVKWYKGFQNNQFGAKPDISGLSPLFPITDLTSLGIAAFPFVFDCFPLRISFQTNNDAVKPLLISDIVINHITIKRMIQGSDWIMVMLVLIDDGLQRDIAFHYNVLEGQLKTKYRGNYDA